MKIQARGFRVLCKFANRRVFFRRQVFEFQGFVQVITRFRQFTEGNFDVLCELGMGIAAESFSSVSARGGNSPPHAAAEFTIVLSRLA